MFRNDSLTVKREVYEVCNGEVLNQRTEVVAENIPCHLSVNLSSVQLKDKTPYLMSDFVLFASSESDVKPNDILLVTTERGQGYKLFAGEIKIYGITVQIKCSQKKIIER